MLPQLSIPGGRKQACEVCRQRKRRCDGQLSTCSACRKAGIRCIYAVPFSKPMMGVTFHAAPRSAPASSTISPSHQAFQSPNNATATGLDDQIGAGTHETANGSDPDPYDDYRGYQPSTLASTQTATVQHTMSDAVTNIRTPSTDASENQLCPLPPHRQAIDLCNVFFSTHHRLLPSVHEKTFMNKLERDVDLVAWTPLFWIMIALASSFDRSPEMQNRHSIWLKTASAKLESVITSPIRPDNTSMLQSGIWMVYQSYSRGDLSGAWLLLGRMCQIAGALELNKIDSERISKRAVVDLRDCSDIEIEERRKSIWCLFLLDRILSSTSGVPLFFDERQFATNFPLPDEVFQRAQESLSEYKDQREPFSIAALDLLNHNTTFAMATNPSFNHILKASIIMGRASVIQNGIRQSSDERTLSELHLLHTALQTFCAAISHPHRPNPSIDTIPLWLVLTLQASRILILHPPGIGAKGLCACSVDPILACSSEGLEAAQTMTTTCHQTLHSTPESLTNPLLLPLLCICARTLATPPTLSEANQSMISSILQTVDHIGKKYPDAAVQCRDAITRRVEGDETRFQTRMYEYMDYDCA